MSKLLIVDDMAIFREPIAASLRRVGYETVCASNGQEALDAIHTKAPDLVLLDLAMPVMDGLTCLRTLRSNPDTKALPVIMLTAMTEREPLKEAVGIGVQGYLLKSQFSLEDLITRVKKVLAQAKGAPAQSSTRERPSARASSTDRGASGRTPEAKDSSPPDPMTESQTLAQIRREAQIRAVPTVLQHVMALTTNNRTSFDEVGAAVRRDHALALKVMKVANSSFFGAGKTAQTLSEAAHRIGMSGVRNTIATIMTIEHFHASALGGLTPQRFWEHSLATGAISDLLGQALGAEDAENLFLAGLLHDIGRLVLSTVFPDHYRAVMEAGAERGINLIPIEKEVFGIAHHEVTREVLTQWETPVEVRDPAWAHELPVTEIRRTVKNSRSALIVSLADRLAHALLLGDSGNSLLLPLDEPEKALGLSGDKIRSVAAEAAEKTTETEMFYASRTSQEFCEPLSIELASSAKCDVKLAVLSGAALDNPLSLFFGQLRWIHEKKPRVVVLHVRSVRELERRVLEVRKLQETLGWRLGVVVASPTGSVVPPPGLLDNQPWSAVAVPGRYTALVACVTRLHHECSAPIAGARA